MSAGNPALRRQVIAIYKGADQKEHLSSSHPIVNHVERKRKNPNVQD